MCSIAPPAVAVTVVERVAAESSTIVVMEFGPSSSRRGRSMSWARIAWHAAAQVSLARFVTASRAGVRPHLLLGVGERRVLVVEFELAHEDDPPIADLGDVRCASMRTARRRARRPRARCGQRHSVGDSQRTSRVPCPRRGDHRGELLEAGAKLTGRASGKTERDRFSTRRSGSVSSPNTLSKSPPVHRGIHSVGTRARFGERRAFSGVVAAFEFAIGALEVVLVEAAGNRRRPSSPISLTWRYARLVSGVV